MFHSDTCKVEMIPQLDILWISGTHNYVMPGTPCAFKVESSFMGNSEDVLETNGFQ